MPTLSEHDASDFSRIAVQRFPVIESAGFLWVNPHLGPASTSDVPAVPDLGFEAAGVCGVELVVEASFDLTTLTPVTQVATGPMIVAASKSFPVNTLGNVIAYAKTNPHRLVLAAGGGTGSPAYLAIELLKAKTGMDVALLAYEGGGPALDDLLRSHVDAVLDGLPVIGPRAKAGLLMPLAVTSAKRLPAWPDLPTVMEAGISDYEIDCWFGIVAPADMPAAIAKRLRDEVAKAVARAKQREPGVEAASVAGMVPQRGRVSMPVGWKAPANWKTSDRAPAQVLLPVQVPALVRQACHPQPAEVRATG